MKTYYFFLKFGCVTLWHDNYLFSLLDLLYLISHYCYNVSIALHLNTTLLFVDKDERTTWKKLVSHGLESSSRLHHYRLFQKLLGEYEGICYLYQNITNEDHATLLHYRATESAIIHQNHVKALELEEKAIAEACGKGTTHIFNLSSMYLDASSYFMKLIKQEQAWDYIEKSVNILV